MPASRGSWWKHPKKKELRQGTYNRVAKNNDRVFQLVGTRNILSFESPKAAKDKGWFIVKK